MSTPRPIVLTNTLGRRVEEFVPLQPGRALMYTCGPTVYSYVHIGNFRSFLFADLLRRVLEYNGYEVVQARNITDVGHLTDETLNTGLDRIEKAALELKRTPHDIVRYYSELFARDASRLNMLEPEFVPKATEYVGPMIDLTKQLIDGGHAYRSNGDVYFDVSTFPEYGRLSGNTVEELVAGARVEVGLGKRHPADFALWRGAGEDKLMRFDSPWGPGVPGWHIECSAMSKELLAEQIDIHTGGVDNIFPHHEDERAQSEAAMGKPFVRYWLHGERLGFGSEKMSKSLGNFYTVQDLIDRGIHPLAYRYFTLQAHYRTPLNFTWEAQEAAQTGLLRIWSAAAELIQRAEPGSIDDSGDAFRERFHEAINRDVNMPVALAALQDTLASLLPAGQKLALLADFDRVLGLDVIGMARRLVETTPEHRALLESRIQARAERDWNHSDVLRRQLAELGLDVKDTAEGQRWVRTDVLMKPVTETV
ncbi:MAG: cysteine--tRNA ligase [Chloroflexota bacterium]